MNDRQEVAVTAFRAKELADADAEGEGSDVGDDQVIDGAIAGDQASLHRRSPGHHLVGIEPALWRLAE